MANSAPITGPQARSAAGLVAGFFNCVGGVAVAWMLLRLWPLLLLLPPNTIAIPGAGCLNLAPQMSQKLKDAVWALFTAG